MKNKHVTSEATDHDLTVLDWLLELENYRKQKERELKLFLEEPCQQ